MNKLSTWVVLGILGVLAIWFIGANNGQVQSANHVRNEWANVQGYYQRRLDIVNQLVSVIVGANEQEAAVMEILADQARGLSGQISQETPPDEAGINEFSQNAQAFDQALINAVSYVADNPEMITGQLYNNLMIEIEGSENRIATARRDYNSAVTSYRNTIEQFPGSVVASISGRSVDDFGLFKASEAAQEAPNPDFSNPPSGG